MRHPTRTFSRSLLQHALAAALLGLALNAGAQASDRLAPDAAHGYQLPAGTLGRTLATFATQAGLALSFDPALTEGLHSPGLAGSYTARQALERLLAGSGLEAVARSDGSFTLRRKPIPTPAGSSGDITLAPMTVTAPGQRDGTTEGTGSFTTRVMSSATHLPLSMRETPQSVTVLTQARIEADNLVDLVDIAKTTPGLSLQSGQIRPRLYSRGYQVDSVTQDGIATLYDWYSGDSLGNLAMQDRVEVVRGATGLMQGGGNPSAAVNMIRKRPTGTWQFKGSASAGSWDDYRLMADASGPLTEDGRVRGRAVAYVQDAGDFYDLGFNDKQLFYVSLDVDLSERTTLNIGYSHLYSNKNLTWGGLPTSYGYRHLDLPRSTYAGADWEYNKNQVDTFYASLAHDFGGGWKLNFNGTYVDGRYGLLATYLIPTPPVGYGHVWSAQQKSREQKAADLNVSGPVSWFGRKHDLVFGATINHQRSPGSEWWQGWGAPLSSGVNLATWNHVLPRPDTSSTSPWRYDYSTYFKQDSLYSAGRFSLTHAVDVILGARLDWYDRVGSIYGGPSVYKENAHLTKYAGLTWKFADQHSAYVSYTDVFQPQDAIDLSGSLLKPIVGKNYEIGVKGEYLDGALNGSIALFRIDEINRAAWLRDQSGCPVPTGCYAAAGLVRTKGVDIELQGALTPNWQIGAGLTWSETRYRKDANPDNIGRRLSNMEPTTLFKLSTQYTLPGALNRLTLGGRINWQSKVIGEWENAYGDIARNQQNARAIVDLSATYRLTKNLNLKLDINNVFDKVYYSSISDDWYWNSAEAYGRPRSVLLTLNANF